jgi:hypothetical protein
MTRWLPALAAAVALLSAAESPAAPQQAWPAQGQTAPQQGVGIVFSCVLQVEESEKAAAQVIARAESLGGWFTRRAKEMLELRVPSALADSFIGGLSTLGVPLDRNLSTQGLDGERDELASRLKARRAILQDYYAMLKESGDSTIFTIQSEIVNLQSEIEQTAGQIQKLESRMAFAEITVYFRFQERGAPLTTGKSRFGWLNILDLPTMMERFDYVRH